MALFKTVSGPLARRQVLGNLLQSIAKQLIPRERLATVTTDVIFNCHIAPLAKLVLNQKILWSHATSIPNCIVLMEIHV